MSGEGDWTTTPQYERVANIVASSASPRVSCSRSPR
jgi:hypothetical protein